MFNCLLYLNVEFKHNLTLNNTLTYLRFTAENPRRQHELFTSKNHAVFLYFN